jgi:hypothetical protein
MSPKMKPNTFVSKLTITVVKRSQKFGLLLQFSKNYLLKEHSHQIGRKFAQSGHTAYEKGIRRHIQFWMVVNFVAQAALAGFV